MGFGVDGTSGAGGVSSINYEGALTPDALMLYCRSRLNDVDTQFRAQTEKQQQARSQVSALTNLQGTLNNMATDGHLDVSNVDRENTVNAAFDSALKTLPPGAERDQVQKTYNEYIKSRDEDHKFAPEEFTNWAKSIEGVSTSLSKSAELDMIQLQSLMSQRQMAVQMCTNMVQSLDDTAKAIAQKIGT